MTRRAGKCCNSAMGINRQYAANEPTRAEIEALAEPLVLEFGAPWCGYCREMQPLLEAALSNHTQVRHIKIADGKGRRLGRLFGIKLWPTLIFMRHGEELERLVRPDNIELIQAAMKKAFAST
jgi:thioredoxin 1